MEQLVSICVIVGMIVGSLIFLKLQLHYINRPPSSLRKRQKTEVPLVILSSKNYTSYTKRIIGKFRVPVVSEIEYIDQKCLEACRHFYSSRDRWLGCSAKLDKMVEIIKKCQHSEYVCICDSDIAILKPLDSVFSDAILNGADIALPVASSISLKSIIISSSSTLIGNGMHNIGVCLVRCTPKVVSFFKKASQIVRSTDKSDEMIINEMIGKGSHGIRIHTLDNIAVQCSPNTPSEEAIKSATIIKIYMPSLLKGIYKQNKEQIINEVYEIYGL